MKATSKVICGAVLLAWIHGALAAEEVTVVQPPSHGVAVKAHPVTKMDRNQVEKRLTDRATRTQKRNEQARKAVLEQQTPLPTVVR